MIKSTIKTGISLLALMLSLGFSSGANAELHGQIERCYNPSPGSGHAYVYTGQNYNGTCYDFLIYNFERWSSWDANDTPGFPNDQIQSVWVGPNTTLVMFWSPFKMQDHGQPLHFGPGEFSPNLSNWNRNVSAARVQSFGFGQCGSAGYISLFADPWWSGDCTELNANSYYGTAAEMGFRDNTVSSMINASNSYFYLFDYYRCQGDFFLLDPLSWSPDMQTHYLNDGSVYVGAKFNDRTSSVSANTGNAYYHCQNDR